MLLPLMKIRIPHPVFILLHITLKCNRNCAWCYQKQDSFYRQHSGDMRLEAFEKILAEAKPGFFLRTHIHLFGGEPLTHPEFPVFLKICKKYNYSPTITTNGDYLREYMEIIKSSTISQLNISLNRPGYDSLEKTYEGLLKCIALLAKEKVINLNFALTPGDYHLLEQVTLFFSSKFKKGAINSFTCQHFFSRNGPSGGKIKGINVYLLEEQIKKLQKEKINFKLLFLPHIGLKDLRKYYYSEFSFRNKCYIPWLGLNIYPDLTVTAGGGVLGCNRILGDLNVTSIREIWRGEKLGSFRDSLLSQGLESRCNRCCHKLYY